MPINNDKTNSTDSKSGQTQPRTQVGELRDVLATLERRIAKLREMSPEMALEILPLLDQANDKLKALEKAGVTTSGEATQLESLLNQLHAKRRELVGKVGGASALRQRREEHQPRESNWWWFIDESIAKERQAMFKRWAFGFIIVGVVLTVLVLVYKQFFAPDPVFQAGIGFQQTAENQLIQGQYEEALENVNQAIERLPDMPELYVMRGVIYEMLEQPHRAEENYDLAFLGFDQEEFFFSARAKYYLMAGLPELAIADAEGAIAINPDSAISYMYIAQAYEMLGDFPTAIDFYETASEVAERTKNATLQVMARMQMATLMQQNMLPTSAAP